MSFLGRVGDTVKKALFGASDNDEEAQISCDGDNVVHDLEDDHIEHTGLLKRKNKSSLASEPIKKRYTRSEEEKRLSGDYTNPPNAQRIIAPGQPGYDDYDRKVGAIMRKPGAASGVFRPQNSLHLGSAPGARVRVEYGGVHGQTKTYDVQPTSQRSRQIHLSATVKGGLATVGDGFEEAEIGEPRRKKQKISDRRAGAGLPSDPIEQLSEEEVTIAKVNGRSTKGKNDGLRGQAPPAKSSQRHFDNSEYKSTEGWLTSDPPKRRKPRAVNGNASSQTSSRASPAATSKDPSSTRQVDLREVIQIEDDSQEVSQQSPDKRSSDLPFELDKGFADVSRRKQIERRDANLESIEAKPAVQSPPSWDKRSNPHPEPQPVKPPKRRRINQAAANVGRPRSSKEPSAELQEKRASQVFVRDGPVAQPHRRLLNREERTKAHDQRASQRGQNPDDSISSIDELSGEKTIGTVSPQKTDLRSGSSPRLTNGKAEPRSSSPSDLKQTQFTQSVKQSPPRKTPKQSFVRRLSGNTSETRLTGFFAVSCCFFGGGFEGELTIRYEGGDKELYICHDGYPVALPGGQCAVHISQSEVQQKVVHCEANNAVFLKGSAGRVSNGSICLTFDNTPGKKWFLQKLFEICGPHLKVEAVSLDQIKNTLKVQTVNLDKECKRHAEVAEKRRVAERAAALEARIQAKGHKAGAEQGEIRYEDEEPKRPSRRREIMAGNAVESRTRLTRPGSPNGRKTSPYFDNISTIRRSTRQAKPAKPRTQTPPPIEKWSQVNNPTPWPHPLVYPSVGARRVTVDFPDVERLDEGEFLNDNLISFALRRIEEEMDPAHKEGVHFFNSFFYTALTNKDGKKGFNYNAVKRWTKGIDILSCRYVVVPINIDFHWFVAIICNLPMLARKSLALEDDESKSNANVSEAVPQGDQELRSDAVEPPSAANTVQGTSEVPDPLADIDKLSISDDGHTSKTLAPEEDVRTKEKHAVNGGGADSLPPVKKDQGTAARKGKKRGPPSRDPDLPTIITLDSLGSTHGGETRNIKDYLLAEAEDKRGMAIDLSELQGQTAKGIPEQSNFCDCGVYLVRYVEQFAKNPRAFITQIMQRQHTDVASGFEGFVPSEKRAEIRDAMLQLQTEQETERKAKKAGKKAATKTIEQSTTSAHPTPKPESRPESKMSSPAPEQGRPSIQTPQQEAHPPPLPPRAKFDEEEWNGFDDEDKNLEVSVPRALAPPPAHQTPPQQSLAIAQRVDNEHEQMLDDPAADPPRDEPTAKDNNGSEDLLENLQAYVSANSQQKGFLAGMDKAAAQEPVPPVPNKPSVIELSDTEEKGPEIADSQDQVQARRDVGRRREEEQQKV